MHNEIQANVTTGSAQNIYSTIRFVTIYLDYQFS
jgi:hypothetical protein